LRHSLIIRYCTDEDSDLSDDGLETEEQLAEALKAAEDKEQPGEVKDNYHQTKFRWKAKCLRDTVVDPTSLDSDVERTPTKEESVQDKENSIDVCVYHLTLTDVSSIDPKISVPIVLICASFKKLAQENSATALHRLLADQSQSRENMTFHLRTYQ
jgi:hypothetical protein